MKKLLIGIIYSVVLIIIGSSCGPYSFSGADTGKAVTLSVATFPNETGQGPANLSQNFTEKLKLYFQQNSKLEIVRAPGDWHIEGRIVNWTLSPIAPQQNETSGMTRLTIRVRVRMTDNVGVEKPNNYEQEFSHYFDYPQTQSLAEVENTAVNQIFDRIVQDIFTRTTSTW